MRVSRRLAVAGAAAVVLAARSAIAQESVLKIVPLDDLRTFDPLSNSSPVIRMHALAVYDTLFAWDLHLNVKPMMVDGYSVSSDRLTYRFTLRPGLRFHDGQPVTTRDVIPSLRRWMARDTLGAKLAQFTAALEATNERNFVLTLKQPFAYVEMALGSAAGMIPVIMREQDAKTDPNKQVTEVIGSGPFRFGRSQLISGARIVYGRNPDYVPRGEPPDGLSGAKIVRVGRMEWDIIPDVATVAAAIQAGEVDYWDGVSLDLVPVLLRANGITVQQLRPFGYFGGIRPNSLYPPFNDPRARQALALMVNQSDFMLAAIGDRKWWQECFAYFMCGAPFGTEAGSASYRHPDHAKARQLLGEAGYQGEKLVLLGTTENPIINALGEVAAQELKSIGISVDLQVNDWATVLTRQNDKSPPGPGSGGWNLLVTYFEGSTNFQPLTNVATNMVCDGSNWAGWPCDRTAEALKSKWIQANGSEAQHAALEAYHRRLWEEVPLILLGQFRQPDAWRSNLKGLLHAAVPVFWNVQKA